MSHDKYEEAITLECLKSSGNQFPEPGSESESDNVYNPFNLKMGQMTVYRCVKYVKSCALSAHCELYRYNLDVPVKPSYN